MANKYHIGDKFVIEIGSEVYSPPRGSRYFIKGFDTLVFDDKGLDRLERYKEPPKAVPHTCENCSFRYVNKDTYPCGICEHNPNEPRDMFEEMAVNG